MKQFLVIFLFLYLILPVKAVENINLDSYYAKVREQIDSASGEIITKDLKDQTKVGIAFQIKKDGTIQNLKILKSSGFKEVDDSVLNSLKKSAPFPPITEKVDILNINYEFNLSPPIVRKEEAAQLKEINKEKYNSYYQKVKERISANWKRPDVKLNNPTKVTVGFEIAMDGSVKNLKIVEYSDNPDIDSSGIKAINDSAPFLPIPEDIGISSLPINYTFAISQMPNFDTEDPYNTLKSEKVKVLTEEEKRKIEEIAKNYSKQVFEQINKSWHPPHDKFFHEKSNIIEIEFVIAKSGVVESTKVITSSLDAELDQSGVQAIQNAGPFQPLPSELNVDRYKFTQKFLLHQDF